MRTLLLQENRVVKDIWINGKFSVPLWNNDVTKGRVVSVRWDPTKTVIVRATLKVSAQCDHGVTKITIDANGDYAMELSWADLEDNKVKTGNVNLTTIKNGDNDFDFTGHNEHWLITGVTFSNIDADIEIEFTGELPNVSPGVDESAIPWKEILTYGGIGLGVMSVIVGVISWRGSVTERRREKIKELERKKELAEMERKELEREKRAEEREERTMRMMMMMRGLG